MLQPTSDEAAALDRVFSALDAPETPDPLDRRRSPVTLPGHRRGLPPANKGRTFPAEVLDAAEVLALLDALPRRGAAALRNRALIVVMWRAGLRVEEALALEPKDLDLDRGAITVLRGKGAKRRVVALDAGARPFLEAWLAARATLELAENAPLFCGTRAGVIGRRMGRPYVTEMLKRYAERAGITKRVHPHGLRHTCAAEMSRAGVPVRLIQQQLGHNDLRMSAHYIDHLAPDEHIERINARPWPGQPSALPPMGAASSDRGLVAASPVAAVLAPPEIRGEAARRVREATRRAERVLELLAANGGTATQAQLRRALGLQRHQAAALLRQLHRLHEEGRIIRAGMDANRSIVWKLAPPTARFTRPSEHRPAPKGDALRRVLDVIEGLGGRASQAQIARALGVTPSSVRKQCQQLAAEGLLEEGALDRSSPGVGSRVWRLPARRARRTDGSSGWTMRVAAPGTRR